MLMLCDSPFILQSEVMMNITLYGASSDRMDAKYKQAVFSPGEIIAEKNTQAYFFDIPVTFFEKRCFIG